MDIQDLRIFSRLAAVQNLSQVGQEFSLTPGTISKRLQGLEQELSVRLFDRTTRSIRITEEGGIFLEHAERMLREYDEARASVGEHAKHPRGRIKIASPARLGAASMADGIALFLSTFPEIEVHAELTDRAVSLHEDGYDAAIRTGVLSDSALKARRLVDDPHVIVASPGYIAEHGRPRRPKDLEGHSCLVQGDIRQWSFVSRGRTTTIRPEGRLRANDGEVLRTASIEGHGIVRIAAARVKEDIEEGRLVRLLAEFDTTGDAAIWAVYPASRHVPPRLRVFLDFVADWLAAEAGGPKARAA